MEGLEDLVDLEKLQELIEPLAGLLIALAFMFFARLIRSSKRRQSTAEAAVPRGFEAPAQQPRRPTAAAPIEPGDDAAKLSKQYSQLRGT